MKTLRAMASFQAASLRIHPRMKGRCLSATTMYANFVPPGYAGLCRLQSCMMKLGCTGCAANAGKPDLACL